MSENMTKWLKTAGWSAAAGLGAAVIHAVADALLPAFIGGTADPFSKPGLLVLAKTAAVAAIVAGLSYLKTPPKEVSK